MSAESRQKVRDLIEKIKICQVVTRGADGRMQSRPMQVVECDDHHNLWFLTAADSCKVAQLEVDHEVLLGFGDPSSRLYLSVSGTASFSREPAHIDALWSEMQRPWFPEGKDDPNLLVMKVEPVSAEYWDSVSSLFVITYGYLKARFTGKVTEFDKNETVRFH